MNWKGEAAQVLTFAVAPAVGACLAVAALRVRLVARLSPRGFVLLAALLWVLTRPLLHVVVFHLFRYAGGHDLLDVWYPIARTLREGGDPTALVDNLYGPLFPYVLALGLFVGGGSYAPAIDVPFVAADALALVLLLRIARRRLDEVLARRVLLFVLLSPLLWHGVIVRTQDEPLFVLGLLAVQDLLDRRREGAAALACAAGTLLTKALFPLWALPLLVAADGDARARLVRVARAALATAAALGVAVALGWDAGARVHPHLTARGSSAWVLFGDGTFPRGVFLAGVAVTALGCVAAAGAAWRRRAVGDDDAGERAARGVVAVQAAFFVLCPFSLPPHLVHGLPWLGWRAVRRAADAAPRELLPLVPAVVLAAVQIPAVWLNAELWRDHAPLVVAFVAWCAWTGYDALATARR